MLGVFDRLQLVIWTEMLAQPYPRSPLPPRPPMSHSLFPWPSICTVAPSSMVPRVLPAHQSGAVLLRAVHQLGIGVSSGTVATRRIRTKNHMEAPRPVAMKR